MIGTLSPESSHSGCELEVPQSHSFREVADRCVKVLVCAYVQLNCLEEVSWLLFDGRFGQWQCHPEHLLLCLTIENNPFGDIPLGEQAEVPCCQCVAIDMYLHKMSICGSRCSGRPFCRGTAEGGITIF